MNKHGAKYGAEYIVKHQSKKLIVEEGLSMKN